MASRNWLIDIGSVRLGSSNLDASVRFGTEILGLQLVRRDARRAYLRAGAGRDHDVVYIRGGTETESLSFEVSSGRSLEDLVASLAREGHLLGEATPYERDERGVEAMYVLTDPTGN